MWAFSFSDTIFSLRWLKQQNVSQNWNKYKKFMYLSCHPSWGAWRRGGVACGSACSRGRCICSSPWSGGAGRSGSGSSSWNWGPSCTLTARRRSAPRTSGSPRAPPPSLSLGCRGHGTSVACGWRCGGRQSHAALPSRSCLEVVAVAEVSGPACAYLHCRILFGYINDVLI